MTDESAPVYCWVCYSECAQGIHFSDIGLSLHGKISIWTDHFLLSTLLLKLYLYIFVFI